MEIERVAPMPKTARLREAELEACPASGDGSGRSSGTAAAGRLRRAGFTAGPARCFFRSFFVLQVRKCRTLLPNWPPNGLAIPPIPRSQIWQRRPEKSGITNNTLQIVLDFEFGTSTNV
jgi:hypothetical protein